MKPERLKQSAFWSDHTAVQLSKNVGVRGWVSHAVGIQPGKVAFIRWFDHNQEVLDEKIADLFSIGLGHVSHCQRGHYRHAEFGPGS
jgi:hypothetical protein